jgi:methionyl aminopeptidase
MDSKSQSTDSQVETQEKNSTSELKDLFVCSTPNCDKPSAMQCPTCVKLGLPPAYFCSQECFKEFWSIHKLFHQKSNFFHIAFIVI